MDHYVDVRLLPDPEFSVAILMSALFAKLHRVFVALDNRQLGISFPEVSPDLAGLGCTLRLHGTSAGLAKLLIQNWLVGMRDHVEVTDIKLVPKDTKHRRIQREQVKSNAERLRRRYRGRHPGASHEEVSAKFANAAEKRTKLAFVQTISQSTGQHFRLFLEHLPPQQQPVDGEFNCYGLSAKATIPWF